MSDLSRRSKAIYELWPELIRGRNEKASNNFHAAQSKSISSSSLLRPTSEERLFPDIKEYKGVCWDVVRFSSSSKSFRRSSVGIPRKNLFYLLVDVATIFHRSTSINPFRTCYQISPKFPPNLYIPA